MDDDSYFGLQNKEQFENKLLEFEASSKVRQMRKELHLPTYSDLDNISFQKSAKKYATHTVRGSFTQIARRNSQMSTMSAVPQKQISLQQISLKKILSQSPKKAESLYHNKISEGSSFPSKQISLRQISLKKVSSSKSPKKADTLYHNRISEESSFCQGMAGDDIYMDLFQQQILQLVNRCCDSSDTQRREAEVIAQELGIPFARVCNLSTPEMREDYIIKVLQEQVRDSLNQQKERVNNKSAQAALAKDDQDIYSWLEVQSKFISLKEKLKFALVEAINDRQNQEQLLSFFSDVNRNKSGSQRAEIKNYPKPDTRNIINELTNLLNQVKLKKFTSLVSSKEDNIEADRVQALKREAQHQMELEQDTIVQKKLEFTSQWDDDKELTFKNKRSSAKERLSKLIKSSSWNQLGCAEFVKQYNDQSTNTFQRDALLDKYSNGEQLSAQEFQFLSNTSTLLNRCCDQKYVLNQNQDDRFIQQAVALLDEKIVQDIELFIAENILKHYYNLLKLTKHQRLIWIAGKTNLLKKSNYIKDKQYEKKCKIEASTEQNQRLKSKLVSMLNSINRNKQEQVKAKAQQQKFLYKEMRQGNDYANPLVWKFKDILMKAVVRKVQRNHEYKKRRLYKEEKDKAQHFMNRLSESKQEKCLFEVKDSEYTVSQCKRTFHPSSKLMVKNLEPAQNLQKRTKEQELEENHKQVKSYKLNIRKRVFEKSQDNFQEFYSGGPNRKRPFASTAASQHSYSDDLTQPYKGSWITSQVEVAAANKIKAAIKSFIQRKKFLVILETVRVTKQKQVEKKIAAHMHSLAYAHYSQKARNTPLNSVEPNVSVAFTNYKEKMSVTIKKNLDDLKMNKKDFYQELKKLGVNQPKQYRRIVLKVKTKVMPKNMQELTLKQRKLFYAVKINNLQWAKDSGFVFNQYDLNTYDPDGKSPLYYAAQQANEEFCAYLINQGADCNMECQDGNTPVHAAFASNSLMILNLFLQNGADINVTNQLGQTPLHFGNQKRLQELNLTNQVATRTGHRQTDNNHINRATFVKVEDIWDQGAEVKNAPLDRGVLTLTKSRSQQEL